LSDSVNAFASASRGLVRVSIFPDANQPDPRPDVFVLVTLAEAKVLRRKLKKAIAGVSG
jgi:hypothetical protein